MLEINDVVLYCIVLSCMALYCMVNSQDSPTMVLSSLFLLMRERIYPQWEQYMPYPVISITTFTVTICKHIVNAPLLNIISNLVIIDYRIFLDHFRFRVVSLRQYFWNLLTHVHWTVSYYTSCPSSRFTCPTHLICCFEELTKLVDDGWLSRCNIFVFSESIW